MTKRDELHQMFKTRIREGLAQCCFDTENRDFAAMLRVNASNISVQLAWHLTEQYRILELFDIVEWRRTRVRR